MRALFIGDAHGRVFHLLAAAGECSRRCGPFDVVVQVGDLGAFPDPHDLDEATRRFSAEDPAELDFSRLVRAEGDLASRLQDVRRRLAAPILFIRGNHEDEAYLSRCLDASTAPTAAADPFDLFHIVADGSVLDVGGAKVGFLGGADYLDENEDRALRSIRDDAVEKLSASGGIEVLVTHDGPYGAATASAAPHKGQRRCRHSSNLCGPSFTPMAITTI